MPKMEVQGAGAYRQVRTAIIKEAARQKQDPTWQALQDRLPPKEYVPSAHELRELIREYEYTKALSTKMVLSITKWQVFVLSVLLITGTVTYLAYDFVPDSAVPVPMKLLLGAYFGALGASAGSLWGMVKHSAGRSLRTSMLQGHYLKPLLGAVMGVLVVLLLPTVGGMSSTTAVPVSQGASAGGTEAPATGADATGSEGAATGAGTAANMTIYALAALAGLFEQSFMRKFQAITDAVLGTESGSASPSSFETEQGQASETPEHEEDQTKEPEESGERPMGGTGSVVMAPPPAAFTPSPNQPEAPAEAAGAIQAPALDEAQSSLLQEAVANQAPELEPLLALVPEGKVADKDVLSLQRAVSREIDASGMDGANLNDRGKQLHRLNEALGRLIDP